jgi:hypothetical protein
MKSIIFVLLMHAHGGNTSPVGAFESIEQCRQAEATASQNQAADYSCESVPVAGEWSRKAQAFLAPLAERSSSARLVSLGTN